jgi:2-C-methyl-D-erythritol 4-phosphate cytidylyltransferase
VAERFGIPLTYTEGEKYNIKITTPEDLTLAGKLLDLN